MPARAANGRFVKSGTRRTTAVRSSGGTTAIVVSPPARSPACRGSRSSPYVVASRARRRKGGGSYAPTKKFAAGGVLGLATEKFKDTYNRLPELGGSRMVAVAGIAHMARNSIPHGSHVAESAAAIAGWEVGKAQAGKMGIAGSGDDF
jgi:hypothetical protein